MDENATQPPARRPSANRPQSDRPQPIAPTWTTTPAPDRAPTAGDAAGEQQPTGLESAPAAPDPLASSDSVAPADSVATGAAQTDELEAAKPTGSSGISTNTDGTVRLRAGDPERQKVVDVLQEAFGKGQLDLAEFDERTTSAWSAVYLDQLVPLTLDLVENPVFPARAAPAPHTSAPQADASHAGAPRLTPSAPSAADRIVGGEGPTFSMALWSGFSRKGTWTVPPQFTGFAMMGGGEIDLRHANFATREVTITAIAIMGGIEIIVPDDVHVHVSGVGFMGAFDDGRKWNDGRPPVPADDAPVVKINGLALMGGIEVTRRSPTTGKRA